MVHFVSLVFESESNIYAFLSTASFISILIAHMPGMPAFEAASDGSFIRRENHVSRLLFFSNSQATTIVFWLYWNKNNAPTHNNSLFVGFETLFAAPGIFPSADGDEVALPLSVGEWIIQYWKEHTEQYRKRPADKRPMECTTHPGDVVFVPHGWWHSVINLDESNIAITHNYVSPSNLGNALKFFREKQDQISGCRDRKESIKPEFIHDVLVEELRTREPRHLDRAMKQTGWTCRAWEETKAEVITDDDNENKSNDPANKKRKIDSGHNRSEDAAKNQKEELSSVMSKTERVPAFSFSFL